MELLWIGCLVIQTICLLALPVIALMMWFVGDMFRGGWLKDEEE